MKAPQNNDLPVLSIAQANILAGNRMANPPNLYSPLDLPTEHSSEEPIGHWKLHSYVRVVSRSPGVVIVLVRLNVRPDRSRLISHIAGNRILAL